MNIAKIVRGIGMLIGYFVKKITPPYFDYIRILFEQGFSTSKLNSKFSKFGEGSFLSPHMFIKGAKYVSIGKGNLFNKYCIIEVNQTKGYSPFIEIGDNCNFGEFTHITCIRRISIGSNLLTGRFVLITDNSHGDFDDLKENIAPLSRKLTSKGDVVIGDNVWLGDQTVILPNVKIGNNAIVAANSVVTKNIPDNSIAAGVPAKIIKSINK